MKKTLAILMSCLLLFSLLFSCAKEDAAVNEWKPAEIEERQDVAEAKGEPRRGGFERQLQL